MKIHILGASGTGVTTLGKHLSKQLNYPYFDCDDYYWEKSANPFTVKRNLQERNDLLITDLAKSEDWILGGSLINWGEQWKAMFDLVIFLKAPLKVRITRLEQREKELYGQAMQDNPEWQERFLKFIQWASKYDEGNVNGRTLRSHELWLKEIKGPVITLFSDVAIEVLSDKIIRTLKEEK